MVNFEVTATFLHQLFKLFLGSDLFLVLRVIQNRYIFLIFWTMHILPVFRFCTYPFMFPVTLNCPWVPPYTIVLRQTQPARNPRDNWLWRRVRWFPLGSLTKWRRKPDHTLHHSDEAQREGLGEAGWLPDPDWKREPNVQTHWSHFERQGPVQNNCCQQGGRVSTKRAVPGAHSEAQET